MIIVSQDKDKIINHDNVQLLWINVNILNKTIKTFYIYADHDFLGEYETEERAKEVLQGIYASYSVEELFKRADRDVQDVICEKYKKSETIPFVFQMPEK